MARDNRAYRDLSQALRRKARAENLPCWLCGRPIDFTAEWKHPMSFTADHVEPLALGGNVRGELRPAHRSCNSRRGAGRPVRAAVQAPVTSRAW